MINTKRRSRVSTTEDFSTGGGLECKLIRSSRKTLSVEIKEGKIIVRAPLRCSNDDIRGFLQCHQRWIDTHLKKNTEKSENADMDGALTAEDIAYLAREAKRVIPERVKIYAEKAGLKYGRITIRSQSGRWGSCSSKGNLNFNCLLMLAPLPVIDSVVVHELCHLKEMNHSDRFYREVLKLYPDYYRCHKWLKDNGEVLILRMKKGKK